MHKMAISLIVVSLWLGTMQTNAQSKRDAHAHPVHDRSPHVHDRSSHVRLTAGVYARR